MKHLLFLACLVGVAALQTSQAALLPKAQAVCTTSPAIGTPGNARSGNATLTDLATPRPDAASFSAAPITPELNSQRSLAEPTLLASNCITFPICADGKCQFFTYCW